MELIVCKLIKVLTILICVIIQSMRCLRFVRIETEIHTWYLLFHTLETSGQMQGGMRALEDLTYDKDFISKHKLLVNELPIISFHTEASAAPMVLATLTCVAHAKLLPWLPLPRFLSASEYVESMLASLKVTALHLRLRSGERSDGLVTRRDAEVPGLVVVRPERRLDHAWMVYSTLRNGCAEADASEMCEALLAILVEIGKRRNSVDHLVTWIWMVTQNFSCMKSTSNCELELTM
jgi:hypothetical protein